MLRSSTPDASPVVPTPIMNYLCLFNYRNNPGKLYALKGSVLSSQRTFTNTTIS